MMKYVVEGCDDCRKEGDEEDRMKKEMKLISKVFNGF